MSFNRDIQLGLCCLNSELKLKKPAVYASRTMTQKKLLEIGEEKGVDEIKKRSIQNLKDILELMHWNEENGIKVFRLSSEIFAHKTNDKIKDYGFDFCKDLLKEIGELSKKYNQRLTFHPGQFNIIGAKDERILENTIRELKHHADIFDLMGLDKNSVMVIHGGGVYGDKQKTMDRWCSNYEKLPENVKNRLVLENCERMYSIADCLEMSKRIGIPVVFDTHHHECFKQIYPDNDLKEVEYYIPLILETWKKKDIKPKFHVSEQGSGKIGHHSDYIEVIPDYLLSIPEKYSVNIDIMIEAKAKEKAIMKLYEKYPFLNCKKLIYSEKIVNINRN